MSRRLSVLVLTLSNLTLILGAPVGATTFVAEPDARLAERAPVVAEVSVTALGFSPGSLRPATDYTVQIERLLRGAPSGSTLVVRVPGGRPAAGTSAAGLKVWGAPVLRLGERAVLFLAPNQDGSYRIADLALGAFHEVDWAGRRLAVRDLSEMVQLRPGTGAAEAPVSFEPATAGELGDSPRDLERFVNWLSEGAHPNTSRAAHDAGAYEVRLTAGERRMLASAFRASSGAAAAGGPEADGTLADSAATLIRILGRSPGAPLTWIGRDDSQSGWPALATLAERLSPAPPQDGEDSHGELLKLEYAGAARSAATLDRFDGENTVLVAGPAADPETAPGFDCQAGGVASLAGTWFDGEGQVLGGGVIFAAGTACLLAGNPAASAGALLAHELPLAMLGGLPVVSRSASGAGADTTFRPAVPAAKSIAPAASPLPSASVAPLAPLASLAGVTPHSDAVAYVPGAERRRKRKHHGGGGGGTPPVSNSNLPPRGYQARACGFDFNRNGVFGEAADCHQICNGGIGGRDAGGVPLNQVYVSCNSGNDNATCGAPGNPCRSIGYAWNNRTAPSGSGMEDIVCFRGSCHEDNIMPGVSGKPGNYLKPQTGSEQRAFELPSHPTMLVGWDYNHNGAYPPFDTADQAVLDGSGLAVAIRLSLNTPNSNLELAHFTVRNYGSGANTSNNNGFLTLGGAPGSSSHIYIHDISIENVNSGKGLDSGNIIFNFFTGNTQLQHVAFENIQVLNAGGYLARGSGPSGTPGDSLFQNGPVRFERLTLVGRACNASGSGACNDPQSQAHVVGFKLWGYISGIEVLDSVLSLNPGAWTPFPSGFGSTAFVAAQCSHDWLIRNNEIDDFKVGLTVQGYAQGYCDGYAARPVDGVVFDRNVFRNTYAPWIYGNNGVVVTGGGPNPQTSIGRVVISNNNFSSAPGWQGMAYIDAGNAGGPDPGNIQFVGNTTFGALTRSGFGAITVVKNNPYPAQTYSFHNNIIAGTGGQENLHTEYAPDGWDADGNVFDPQAAYTWNSASQVVLPSWQHASGKDASSRACAPRFLNPGGGDYHLQPGDACAGAAGGGLPPAAGKRLRP